MHPLKSHDYSLYALCFFKANRLNMVFHAYNTNQGGKIRGIRLYNKLKARPGLLDKQTNKTGKQNEF